MFNFLHLSRARDPDQFALTDETRAWLASISDVDTPAAAIALIDRIVSLNQAQLQTRLRLRLLEMFSEQAIKLLPELEQRFNKMPPPLNGNARQAAYLVEKLCKELAFGYSSLVLRTPRLWLSAGFKRQMHAPLLRAMDYHARRLALSERLYAPSPQGIWLALHQLYRLAGTWKIEEQEDSTKVSALSVYREALLLAFAQPQQLGPGDCKRVQAYLRQYSHLADLQIDQSAVEAGAIFLIDIGADSPGFAYAKRSKASSGPNRLVLNTRQLVAAVQTELKQLRQASAAHSQAHRMDLLQRLDDSWRGERLQRAARTRFHPRAEVWAGLGVIWRLLLNTTRKAPMPPTNGGGWLILNESARGFALKLVSGSAPPMAVGEIVALRADGRGKLHICVVRWIVSQGPEHLEVGLEQLAPLVIPASYKKHGKRPTPADAVLYLPTLPGPQQSALVIAAPALVNMTRAVELRHAHGHLALHATRIAETTASVQLIEVVPA